MNYLQAAILGIIQGLTEFLPVSSSGHLVLGQELLGVNDPGITFEIVVHIGTLVAVIIYYRLIIWRLMKCLFVPAMKDDRAMLGYLTIGTIPAAIAGFAFEPFFEETFGYPALTGSFMVVTGFLLFATRWAPRGNREVGKKESLLIGISQAFSIFDGISRSGATISVGLFSGLKSTTAANFSFLLSIPAITGAIVFKLDEVALVSDISVGPYTLAAILSFVFGFAAVSGMIRVLQRGKLEYFAYYCVAVGIFAMYYFT